MRHISSIVSSPSRGTDSQLQAEGSPTIDSGPASAATKVRKVLYNQAVKEPACPRSAWPHNNDNNINNNNRPSLSFLLTSSPMSHSLLNPSFQPPYPLPLTSTKYITNPSPTPSQSQGPLADSSALKSGATVIGRGMVRGSHRSTRRGSAFQLPRAPHPR
jgi:hypothetical protein